jgi:hypothetical protein
MAEWLVLLRNFENSYEIGQKGQKLKQNKEI